MGDFAEDQHPRDEAGKFAEGGGAGHVARSEARAISLRNNSPQAHAEMHRAVAARHEEKGERHDAEKHREIAAKYDKQAARGETTAKGNRTPGAYAAEKADKHRDAASTRRAAAAKEADPVRRSEHLARAAHHDGRAAEHDAKASVEKEAAGIHEDAHGLAGLAEKHSGEKMAPGHDEHGEGQEEGGHGAHEPHGEHGKGGLAEWASKKLEGAKEGVEHLGERVGKVEEATLEEGGALRGLGEAAKLAASAPGAAVGGLASKLGPEEHEGHGGEHE